MLHAALRSTLVAAALCAVGCSAVESSSAHGTVDELAAWMTGAFDSSAQAEADPENYYAVRLVMFPIWTERDDGRWLYVEQAVSTALDRPYRQRVYHLSEGDGELLSAVYELPGDPLVFAGAWARPARFAGFGPDDLVTREGCTIHLCRAGEIYVGATRADECKSTLRGATYATSEVEVAPDRLTSWDRGWNDAGEHIWGATEGAYVFERIPAPF